MKKVIESKKLVSPNEDNFILDNILGKFLGSSKSARARALILALAMLFMAGCGKSNNNNTAAKPETTIEATIDTPAPTATPEPTVDPEIARQEEARMEKSRVEAAAKDYYERLSAIPGYPYNEEEVLTMVNVFNGHYDQSKLGTQSSIESYVREIKMYPMAFANTLLYNDSIPENSNINTNPESYKNFPDTAVGKDILKVMEELGSKVYSSRRNDREAFKANASLFLSLIGRIYFSQTSSEANWNGTEIPTRDEMNIHIEGILRYHALGYLAIILNDVDGKNLTASDNECYTALKLINWLAGGINCQDVSIYEQDSSLRLENELENAKEKSLTLEP